MSYVEPLEGRCYLSALYVSPTGSDSAAGTLAKPFQTIQHAANVAKPGDTVFIKAGVYHETVTVPRSGTARKPITFEPYRNQSVTIDGADPISGFTAGTGNALTTSAMTWNLGDGNNQLFLNGHPLTEAQWPNAPVSPTSVFDQNFDTVVAASTQPGAMGLTSGTITSPNLTAPPADLPGGDDSHQPGGSMGVSDRDRYQIQRWQPDLFIYSLQRFHRRTTATREPVLPDRRRARRWMCPASGFSIPRRRRSH